jgi:hypothetical protein
MPKNMKQAGYVERYGLFWEELVHPVELEMEMIRNGGRWKTRQGKEVGEGLFFHFKRLQQLLDPEKDWHRWNELILKSFIENRFIALIGSASSGKTREAADFARMNYYVWFDQITVILTSTERDRLEERVWGEIKKGHKKAKAIYPLLPGHLIESRQRLITDLKTAENEGRDVRNGMVGIPTKKGSTYVGISAFSGLKNKRVMLIGDELQFMNVSYIDSISNLNKNTEFKCIGIGNPKDISDALGKLAEPAAEIGGWDSGIDQSGGTKTWKTRFNNGIAVQLVGTDSPNMDVPEDVPPPYPYLITREAIASDIAFYGLDSIQYTMQNAGRFPRGEGSRRVITRQMCGKFHAMESPVWKDETRTRIGGVDAAYTGLGGDRTIFSEIQFGPDPNGKIILALITTMLVPVTSDNPEMPEHQIATFVMNECKTRNIPPENLFFDSSGRGSLALTFGQVWSPNVVGIEFGGKPSERPVSAQITTKACDYYSKKVSELWFNVRHVIMAGQFRGMTEEVMQEGIYKEWGTVGANKTEVETKKDTKLKSGRSTDLFDSLICAVEGARQRGFVIANTASKVSTKLTNDFKERIEARLTRLRKSWELTYS